MITYRCACGQNLQVADELAGTYRGMDIAVPDADWEVFRAADAPALADLLKGIVTAMPVAYYRKYPSRPRKGPKKPRQPAPRKHVSTHRLLKPHLYQDNVDT